ncbi:PREDICTED: coiled-coil domain-containing protein 34-like [Priapulus caudatus]|uniref:Coiled-coil domain-containing protein 34-like n=1 Tax=Priapulus caudatus TaxID=37621 RepID=A0ABM1E8U1_PRICU|nr:PREDICTED: coiled-coil domain-containing protein 34-like [Priapulus caudatus]
MSDRYDSSSHHTKTSTPKKYHPHTTPLLDESVASTVTRDEAVASTLESLSLHSEPVCKSAGINQSTTVSTSSGTGKSATCRTLAEDGDDVFQELPVDGCSSDDSETETEGEISKGRLSMSSAAEPCIPPWEKWLVQKEMQRRRSLSDLARKEEVALHLQKEQEKQRDQKKSLANAHFKQWLREKEANNILAKQSADKRKILQDQEREAKRKLREKAKVRYTEWLAQKQKEDLARVQKEIEQNMVEKKQAEERRRKADIAFKQWRRESESRLESLPAGYLTDYPVPTYCNPNPWIPPDIPKPKNEPHTPRKKLPKSSTMNVRRPRTSQAGGMRSISVQVYNTRCNSRSAKSLQLL